jgi:hypothetical protein
MVMKRILVLFMLFASLAGTTAYGIDTLLTIHADDMKRFEPKIRLISLGKKT